MRTVDAILAECPALGRPHSRVRNGYQISPPDERSPLRDVQRYAERALRDGDLVAQAHALALLKHHTDNDN